MEKSLIDTFKYVAGCAVGAIAIPAIPLMLFSGHIPFMGNDVPPNTYPKDGIAEDLKILPPSTMDYSSFASITNNPNNDRASSVPYTSISDISLDERVPVTLSQPEFFSVAELNLPKSTCTATYTMLETHDTTDGSAIATTASHCVLDRNDNPIPASKMQMSFHYIDGTGAEAVFKSGVSDYFELGDDDGHDDRAIILLSSVPPDDIVPSITKVDYRASQHAGEMAIIGRSGDTTGLHQDVDSVFSWSWDARVFNNKDCHASPGASGGPIGLGTVNNHLVNLGALSFVAPGSNRCGAYLYTSDFLDQVPFLVRRKNIANVTPSPL